MIYIHVGHSKTGSSAIQSFLALNQRLLFKHGLEYPSHPSLEKAAAGRISSGNIAYRNDWAEYILSRTHGYGANTLLFSNELLFLQILRDQSQLRMLTESRDVVIILFVRDPLEHLFSMYGQAVKRGGYVRTVKDFLHSYKTPSEVVQFLETCRQSGTRVVIRNYSNHLKDLIPTFFEIVLGGSSAEFLEEAEYLGEPVNRSLTRGEYEIQRLFNRHYGKASSSFISDALVEQLPGLAAEVEPLDDASIDSFTNSISADVATINASIEPGEYLSLEVRDGWRAEANDVFNFQREQLRVLVVSISNELRRLNERALKDGDADVLRDLALKYETGSPPTKAEAILLMMLAQRARPSGLVIAQKLRDWKKDA